MFRISLNEHKQGNTTRTLVWEYRDLKDYKSLMFVHTEIRSATMLIVLWRFVLS